VEVPFVQVQGRNGQRLQDIDGVAKGVSSPRDIGFGVVTALFLLLLPLP
jgi:hypothetical protein